jgi:hypothetical protein
MIAKHLLSVAAAALLWASPVRAESQPGLPGRWRLVPEASTDLSPWKTSELRISVAGTVVTIRNALANGNRAIETVTRLDLSREVSIVPIPWWTDNRHIGAYIGGDRTERVRARWLDEGRILRTDADLVLEGQQGPRNVNILTDYKVSPSGRLLTVVQLRSIRDIPIVYVFERVGKEGAQ